MKQKIFVQIFMFPRIRILIVQTGTANPVWNEGVTIPQVEHLDAKLVVTVCNKRAMGRWVGVKKKESLGGLILDRLRFSVASTGLL